jgi:hypothetical protein
MENQGMEHSSGDRQRGMTFIGALFVLALIGTLGYGGLRLTPVYLNYMKVARTLDVTASEFKGENADQGGIRRSLEKHWQIEDISSVDPKDVEILKDDNGLSLHVAYDDSVPYISNVSLSVHFDKTVTMQ